MNIDPMDDSILETRSPSRPPKRPKWAALAIVIGGLLAAAVYLEKCAQVKP